MLGLTPAAIEAVKGIVGSDAEDGAGLRIVVESAGEDEAEFGMSVEDEPEEGDVVLEAEGVLIFLDSSAAELLDDMVLDAEGHDDHFHFSMLQQGDED
jgi:iron-sulfur cluster assembly protein